MSWLADASDGRRLVLTRFGRAAAVVDSADRLDRDLMLLRQAAEAIVTSAADMASSRTKTVDLDDICGRLGLEPAVVRARAAQLRDADV
ncbi:MAG: hypothetical protein ACR2HR_02190 [Euzebya sp.]